MNNLYAFVNVHGWYYNLVNLLPIEDKLDVMRIMHVQARKLNEPVGFLVSFLNSFYKALHVASR